MGQVHGRLRKYEVGHNMFSSDSKCNNPWKVRESHGGTQSTTKIAVTRNSTVGVPMTIGTTPVQAQASMRLFETLRRSRPILFFVLCFQASLCLEMKLQVRRSDMLLKAT